MKRWIENHFSWATEITAAWPQLHWKWRCMWLPGSVVLACVRTCGRENLFPTLCFLSRINLYRGTEGGTPCTLVSPALLKRQWRFSVKIHTFWSPLVPLYSSNTRILRLVILQWIKKRSRASALYKNSPKPDNFASAITNQVLCLL